MISLISLYMALSIFTLNCNGIRDPSKRSGLFHWVRSLPVKPDIICPQEVHCSSVQECSSWFLSYIWVQVPGPGLWKLNTAILKDDEYVRLVSDLWQAWRGSMNNFSTIAKW